MLTKSLFIRLFIRKPCGKFESLMILQYSVLRKTEKQKTKNRKRTQKQKRHNYRQGYKWTAIRVFRFY